MKPDVSNAVFALLDDCDANTAHRTSRLYTELVRAYAATEGTQLDEVCEAAAADVAAGLHAVVLGDYEFGRNLHLKGVGAKERGQHGAGSLRFLLFARCEKLTRQEVDAWLSDREGGANLPSVAGAANIVESVTPDEFDAAISAVHEALVAGESYQINYTYRLAFEAFGSPIGLYRRLRARQPVQYGALIALSHDEWIVSCSPELFVEKSGEHLRTRPMKGTTARGRTPEEDACAEAFLRNDPKNRAENLMIVDLLRNDVARVAKTGSVRVPALFSVEAYPSIWAMTSTIEAEAVPGVSFADLLRALFPCGSITGAPKHRTMQLIDDIETTPRGLYTGTIGWYDAAPGGNRLEAGQGDHANRAPCGDFCLSVAIRTLTLSARDSATGLRRGMMGVGGGIVLDSIAADEYAECRLKAKFLTGADPGFQLFETMRACRAAGGAHVERHLTRLQRSAAQLGFLFDEAAVRARIAEQCAQLPETGDHRVRLALAKDGALEISTGPLGPVKTLIDAAAQVDRASAGGHFAHAAKAATGTFTWLDNGTEVGVLLAPEHGFAPTRSGDFLLNHKTTHRADYDRGWREAEARGGFDMLFFNDRGELTEGGRSNVFVRLDGQWWTPPLESGLLPGVMRQVLLEDTMFAARERVLTLADVRCAEALVVCNALRGALPARIISISPAEKSVAPGAGTA
ncbi:MAG TPA: bifunctional anthranilate synthase component I family protein/class IV aminotransferase [Trinickia sp.]|uniref:bifunctional anthranilate synthase component I family protein/class IV aminotransferase n=1 Tax=Trinickia sp. TaxID=2571163 RepID=UPI002C77064A|nr:bifunctional anthranilate synthase component I family protein/class IV aminotransferase [Trinickia sp.]HTI17380.1 bifunctional anthranilate synthase component I family protein/class IV aminotransferase [Trinickia sp.]